jgi:sucrose-6-phosphate hydrolase SacC (GH32 family)
LPSDLTRRGGISRSAWCGALTVLWELGLTEAPQGIRLIQQLVPELESLRDEHWHRHDDIITPSNAGLLDEVTGRSAGCPKGA